MTVVTNLRRYAFQLTATEAQGSSHPDIIFDVRFVYPEEPHTVIEVPPPDPPPAAPPSVDRLNFARLGSGVRIASPAPNFIKKFRCLMRPAGTVVLPRPDRESRGSVGKQQKAKSSGFLAATGMGSVPKHCFPPA